MVAGRTYLCWFSLLADLSCLYLWTLDFISLLITLTQDISLCSLISNNSLGFGLDSQHCFGSRLGFTLLLLVQTLLYALILGSLPATAISYIVYSIGSVWVFVLCLLVTWRFALLLDCAALYMAWRAYHHFLSRGLSALLSGNLVRQHGTSSGFSFILADNKPRCAPPALHILLSSFFYHLTFSSSYMLLPTFTAVRGFFLNSSYVGFLHT